MFNNFVLIDIWTDNTFPITTPWFRNTRKKAIFLNRLIIIGNYFKNKFISLRHQIRQYYETDNLHHCSRITPMFTDSLGPNFVWDLAWPLYLYGFSKCYILGWQQNKQIRGRVLCSTCSISSSSRHTAFQDIRPYSILSSVQVGVYKVYFIHTS